MIRTNQLRATGNTRRLAACLRWCLVALACATTAVAQTEAQPEVQTEPAQQTPAQAPQSAPAKPAESTASGTTVVAVGAQSTEPAPGKRHQREAESAYLAGAKKLEHDDLNAAETDFQRALKLDPANRNYAIAISVTRQHRLIELVQQATKARQAGDQGKVETLLAEARAIDPENPVLLEHSGPFYVSSASAQQAVPSAPGQVVPNNQTGNNTPAPLTDRARLIASAEADSSPIVKAPALGGAIHVTPAAGVKSFHLRGASADVLRQVAGAYGINAAVDDSVDRKNLRFDLENVTYQKAMDVLLNMTHAFAVPVDETGIVIARDDMADRSRLESQLQETIYVPGYSAAETTDLVNMLKGIFNVKQIDTSQGNIILRAPEDVLDPLNRTLQNLIEASGEVMVDVKLYEVDMTHMVNAGANVPTQFSVFNVDQAANQIVNANQTIVQQAIAQGLVPPGTSNLEIALALIKLGLVQSSLAANLIGVIGGGALQTGISASTSTTFNLGLNSTDSRVLDSLQQRVGDRQTATFREGTRYPIVTSTYSTGLSTAGSALGNATINGVSVASLLQKYAGGTSATIPQVTYEDLGVTLKATPVIQRSGQIGLSMDLKIEALSGNSNDGNPILNNRQFTSVLTVGDGESVLMVSNVSKTESGAISGLPGLSELPGFQMPTEANLQKDSSQLVVLVTPHIVRRPPGLLMGPRLPVRAQAN